MTEDHQLPFYRDVLRRFERPMTVFRRVAVISCEDGPRDQHSMMMARPYCERLCGPGLYAPSALATTLGPGSHTVVFIATEGVCSVVSRTERLRAIYVLYGAAEYSSDAMAKLTTRADIDFEGIVQLDFDENGSQPSSGCQHDWRLTTSVNAFSGEQSEFFAHVDAFGHYALMQGYCPEIYGHDLVFETPNRHGVSTRTRPGPRFCQRTELEGAVILGEGALVWPSAERHSDRYGAVSLAKQPVEGSEDVALQLSDRAEIT